MSAIPSSTPSDLHVLYQQGNQEAGNRLLHLMLPIFFAIAWRILHNREDAEDAAQEAGLKLLAAPYDPSRCPLEPLARRIAVNATLDLQRRKERRPTLSLFPCDIAEPEQPDTLESEEHERLRQEIERLPAAERQTLRLRFFEGLSYPECAEQMGRSKTAVYMLSHRAVESLRRTYDQRHAA